MAVLALRLTTATPRTEYYTQSSRFQLEKTGIEVIELMPPAVKTDLAADIAEGDVFTLMTLGVQ
jgi:short-subunit dehydrogenase involved in D-alanine esterification of teichoic acids